jgi:biopolymer transport protein ExbB/TolQ
VTTAGGLGVGIAGLAAHALLSRLADERSAMLEERAAELFACVHRPDAIARFEIGRDEDDRP